MLSREQGFQEKESGLLGNSTDYNSILNKAIFICCLLYIVNILSAISGLRSPEINVMLIIHTVIAISLIAIYLLKEILSYKTKINIIQLILYAMCCGELYFHGLAPSSVGLFVFAIVLLSELKSTLSGITFFIFSIIYFLIVWYLQYVNVIRYPSSLADINGNQMLWLIDLLSYISLGIILLFFKNRIVNLFNTRFMSLLVKKKQLERDLIYKNEEVTLLVKKSDILSKREADLLKLFNSTSEAIVIWTYNNDNDNEEEKFIISDINNQFEATLDKNKSFYLGKKLSNLFKIDYEKITPNLNILVSSGQPFDFNFHNNESKSLYHYRFIKLTENTFATIVRDNTNLQHFEDELSHSEELRLKLFNKTLSGVLLVYEGKIYSANPRACELLQCKEADLIGISPFEISSPIQFNGTKSTEQYQELVTRVNRENTAGGVWKIKRLNNSVFDAEISMSKIETKKRNYVQIEFHDITKLLVADKTLKESEQRLRNVFSKAPVGILIHTENRIEFANEYFTDLTETDLELLQTKSLNYIFADKHELENYMCDLSQCTGKTFFDKDILIKTAGHEVNRIAHLHSSFIDPGKKEKWIISVIYDVTEKFENTKLLKESEERYKDIFYNSHSVMMIIDPVTRLIVKVNNSASKFYGYTPEEMLSMRIDEINISDQETITREMEKARTNKRQYFLFKHKLKSGEIRDVEVYSGKITIDSVPLLYSIVHDISEKVKISAELNKAIQRAEASDKLKGEFLAQISHEIRTPVGAILNFTDLLKDRYQNRDDLSNEIFSSIENSSKRIINTINSIVNMAELTAGSYNYSARQLDLGKDILTPVINEYSFKIKEKNLKLVSNYNLGEYNIIADEYSVNQIFVNLIDNAVKYTNEGGISIFLKRISGSDIQVEISDTGIGIADEFLPGLFQPFTQEEQGYCRSFEGCGLGLSLVKSYCDLNNLSIDIKTKKGKGTSVYLTFPVFS